MKNPDFQAVKARENVHRGLHEMCEHLYGDRNVGTPEEVTSLVDIAMAIGEFNERQALLVGQFVSHIVQASVLSRETAA